MLYTHWLTDEPLSITNLDLTVKPDCGHLLQPLEAERVELEHGAAVFGVLENSHSVVRGAAGGKHINQSPPTLLQAKLCRTVLTDLTTECEHVAISWRQYVPEQSRFYANSAKFVHSFLS